jgi:hypothetical protein
MSFWFFVGTVVVSLTLSPRFVSRSQIVAQVRLRRQHARRNFGDGDGSKPIQPLRQQQGRVCDVIG